MRGETAREPAGGRALLPSWRSDASADGANAAGLKPWAALYLLLVTTLVLGLAQHLFVHVPPSAIGAKAWLTFALLAGASALAQLFVVITPRHQSYHTTIVFLIPAALLLPPELLPLIALVQHVPEWLKERYAWYIQSFNIANYALDLLAASASARAIIGAESLLPDPRLRTAVAWVAAAVVLVAGNHVLLALMLRLGRGHSWRSSGLFTFESLSTDLVLATLGVVLTCVWRANGWLAGLALAPLLLIHRSLAVPALEAEARIDAKTRLFNAGYFAEALRAELERAERLQQPFSLLMVDLDLLREINNSYGHLGGDAVLQGIGAVFRQELRDEDVAARFGGEEFSVLLPNTSAETALDVAERLRRAVALCGFTVETSLEPIKATISLGVAAFPVHGTSENELIHQADLAVYRAKLQGRNRALLAGPESLLLAEQRRMRPRRLPQREQSVPPPLPRQPRPKEERRRAAVQPQRVSGPRFTSLSRPLAAFVGAVGAAGLAAGAVGMVSGQSRDLLGMLVVCALVSAGQALALEFVDGSISVSAVGALAGAALFGTRIALALALATALVDWSARRPPRHRFVFNLGALSLASLCACGVFGLVRSSGFGVVPAGAAAGLGYFATNTGLLSAALALEGKTQLVGIWRERFGWLLPHYLAYGLIGSAIALGYHAVGLYALGVFAIPLLLIRNTQGSYLAHTQRSVEKLSTAAEMIERQNVSLEQANRLLQERSLAAMESLAATVDARDSYTAGHSRRVQQLALAVGKELGLSQAELDVLAAAALFHDIGKLAIPDTILLKPSMLSSDEWKQMRLHAEEGAQIIERLGFLADSVPAIEHHHERWDGTGYPAGLAGEEIPLGARIIHVVDALDSMLTERLYRPARPLDEVLREIRTGDGSQFCPRCVLALERVLAPESVAASGSEATESVARDYEKSGRVELPKAQQLSAA
jgi:diguanylate cyclase (GGDEF)-like protein/putative nucleotidyltransferase with HDIG domain